jgi:UDP-N-acetylglucosamine acyltransferase
MRYIHPTALVDEKANLPDNIVIGPWCRIGENVTLGNNCKLISNVLISGKTTIGKNNSFYHSAVIGSHPQDIKFTGEETQLVIGDNNIFREFVTVNLSTSMEEATRIGNNCMLMTYTHVAHNCQLKDNVILANAVNLAGHVHLEKNVTIGGMSAVHQFVRIGTFSFIGGKSGLKKDIPPFTRGEGMPYKVIGLNSIGLQRNGFSSETIAGIKKIYRLFYQSGKNVSQALKATEELQDLSAEQKYFIDFIRNSNRGINR